jgi:hypothetical protein
VREHRIRRVIAGAAFLKHCDRPEDSCHTCDGSVEYDTLSTFYGGDHVSQALACFAMVAGLVAAFLPFAATTKEKVSVCVAWVQPSCREVWPRAQFIEMPSSAPPIPQNGLIPSGLQSQSEVLATNWARFSSTCDKDKPITRLRGPAQLLNFSCISNLNVKRRSDFNAFPIAP